MTVTRAKQITTGNWRKSSQPIAVWAGKFTYSDDEVPIEIEIHPERKGVFRTADGWYPISSSNISGEAMELEVDFVNEVPPSDLDIEIVRELAGGNGHNRRRVSPE